MKVDQLPKVGYILRSLVRHAGNIVLEDQHGGRPIAISADFLNIDDGTIGDASHLIQPRTALPLEFLWPFGLAAQQEVCGDSRT